MSQYRAIKTKQELEEILERSCSPSRSCSYVIGPDTTGRICHVATCFNFQEAKRLANKLNEVELNVKQRN